MSQIFKVDLYKIVRWLIPPPIRQPKLTALLDALVRPLVQLYGTFSQARNANLYVLGHNSQVVYLEKVLNDRFDPSQKRITIADGKLYNQLYIYSVTAGLPVFIEQNEPLYLLSSSKYKEGYFDFVVLQNGVKISKTELFELKANVDKYKLAGKRYKVLDNEP